MCVCVNVARAMARGNGMKKTHNNKKDMRASAGFEFTAYERDGKKTNMVLLTHTIRFMPVRRQVYTIHSTHTRTHTKYIWYALFLCLQNFVVKYVRYR